MSPAPQHSRAPSPSIPALTPTLLDRAGRGMLRRAGGSTEQASQARTCLGPEVEEKLPSFPAPLLELGLQGASPRLLLVSRAPPKEQLPEHVGQRLGPAGVSGTERPPRCCLPSSGCSQTPWALAGSSWTSSPVPGHGPQGPERPVSRVWLLPSPPPTHICPELWGEIRAKLLNTLPGGPTRGEDPRQLLGWGRGVSPLQPLLLKASPVPDPTRNLHSQTGLWGKLTINETFLLSLCRALSPPPVLASQACGAPPAAPDLPGRAWGAHLPSRSTSSPAGLWGLGSGTAKQLPALSPARTPPRCTPRFCPTPSRPCPAELARWGGSD